MRMRRTIIVSIAFFLISMIAGRGVSQMSSPPSLPPPPKRLPGMTPEEWFYQWKQKEKEQSERDLNKMSLELTRIMREMVGITDEQWKVIEPRYKKVEEILREGTIVAESGINIKGNQEVIYWVKNSEKRNKSVGAKVLTEMTEGEQIVDELIDLLRDENSKDEEIKRKMVALEQAREKINKKLPKAKQELRAVLTTPEQEALFLLFGYID